MAGDRSAGAVIEAGLGRAGGRVRRQRRRGSDRILTALFALPLQAQEAINWQEWNKEIDPKLVQQFKQAYESEYGCQAGRLQPLQITARALSVSFAAPSFAADLPCYSLLPCACVCVCAAMKLPKYEGNDLADATAQFAALMKEADALVASSETRMQEIKVSGWAPTQLDNRTEAKRRARGAVCGTAVAGKGAIRTAGQQRQQRIWCGARQLARCWSPDPAVPCCVPLLPLHLCAG